MFRCAPTASLCRASSFHRVWILVLSCAFFKVFDLEIFSSWQVYHKPEGLWSPIATARIELYHWTDPGPESNTYLSHIVHVDYWLYSSSISGSTATEAARYELFLEDSVAGTRCFEHAWLIFHHSVDIQPQILLEMISCSHPAVPNVKIEHGQFIPALRKSVDTFEINHPQKIEAHPLLHLH